MLRGGSVYFKAHSAFSSAVHLHMLDCVGESVLAGGGGYVFDTGSIEPGRLTHDIFKLHQ